MDKEESKAINLFNTSLAQVIYSMNQYYLYKKIYHLSDASLTIFFSRVNRKLMGRK
jgi:bacterioferritin (cytochrome b1)